LWPGVAIAILQLLAIFVVPIFVTKFGPIAILGGFVGGLLVIIWWLFFSRAPWVERIGVLLLMVIAVFATKRIVHASIAGGMMGMMIVALSVPTLTVLLVAAAVVSRRLSDGARRAVIIGAILLGCVGFILIRTGGITGDAAMDIHWRWAKTPEEKLLAQGEEPTVPSVNSTGGTAVSLANASAEADWPGFRGAKRDGVVHASHIETNWSQHPPTALWRRPVGPAWSSFAVSGDLVYTQEQRGDDEVVSCYDLNTGKPVWRHNDKARFYESNAGAGPRGTPTVSNGRVYAFGGTGILNALDARTGAAIWSRNAAADTKAKLPGWGFAGSPIVVGDVVIVATSGMLAGYDAANGNPKWTGPSNGHGYSSPQLATIGGVTQVLLLNNEGVTSVAPNDGTVLWKHAWDGDGIVQPAITADGDVLLSSGSGMGSQVGVRRLAVEHGAGGWTAKERWTSTELNPYFNDIVIHKDTVFGIDGDTLTCIDLKSGALKWKAGDYGHGQLVLLPDQDLLLIVSEQGELALVKATGEKFEEVAKFKAIQGKTWNHPVVVRDTLLVRNGEEMAAYRLSAAK
jgi:outer membrane protein assembly factor BamB/uncharacterized membrane protein YhaH (DUF805 family)